MNADQLLQPLNEILDELRCARDLAHQELLRSDELKQLATNVGPRLKSLRPLFSDEWQRRYDKATQNRWQNELRGDFANIKEHENRVGHLEKFIADLLEHLTGTPAKRDDYITAGRPFDARTRLRALFKLANNEIILVDNFVHPDMLAVLQPHVEAQPNLSLKFLTRRRNNRNFKSFNADLNVFIQQYPDRQIEAKENDQCHDRFIIIDGNTVYHSGHSFHDLGQTASHINKIEDLSESQRVIADFRTWWTTGNSLI